MAGMRQLVDPPSFTPTPYGLLTTIEYPEATDTKWQGGITYQPMCGQAVTGLGSSTYSDCIAITGAGGAPPPAAPLSGSVSVAPRGATAFTVYAEFDCATVGNTQAQATAERAMAMAEAWQVERAFWTGVAGSQPVVYPHLASGTTLSDVSGILLQTAAINVTGVGSIGVTGDLMNIEAALGLLEGALANCYGGIGVIHVPELLLPTMDAWGIVKAVGPVMKTLNGNKVAVGAGYPGTSPAGTVRDANSVWMYATGNVFGYRSAVRVRSPLESSVDRSNNTIRMVAERTYVLGWDCCHFAVETALGVPRGT